MHHKGHNQQYHSLEDFHNIHNRKCLVCSLKHNAGRGDLIGIRKLQQKYKGRVILCWSNKESKTQNLVQWKDEDGDIKVYLDRNRFVQACVDEIKEVRMTFNGKLDDWQSFFKHALNIYRVKEITGDENFSGPFPLLIKFLDAEDILSVQVHPDSQTCRRMGKGKPKAECWYIISAVSGAVIYKGLKKGVSKEELDRKSVV